jgi:hypothetical protein
MREAREEGQCDPGSGARMPAPAPATQSARPAKLSKEQLAARRALFLECQAYLFDDADAHPNVLR